MLEWWELPGLRVQRLRLVETCIEVGILLLLSLMLVLLWSIVGIKLRGQRLLAGNKGRVDITDMLLVLIRLLVAVHARVHVQSRMLRNLGTR